MDIRKRAISLVKKHDTRDPLAMATSMGYLVLHVPLDGIRGFYQYAKRCHIIYLDSDLSDETAAFVCAHEIGHSVLHRGMNRIFMDRHTYMKTTRYEWEADQFAAELLFSDDYLQDFVAFPTETVANCLGLSPKLTEYRLGTVPTTDLFGFFET